MNLIEAVILGIVQGAGEFLPISSSGHLIAVPWLLGYERNVAARLSFLMALPVTLGAVVLKVPKMLAGGLDASLLVGVVTAGVVGVLSIRVLFAWVRTRSYLPFVIYRFAFSLLILIVWFSRS